MSEIGGQMKRTKPKATLNTFENKQEKKKGKLFFFEREGEKINDEKQMNKLKVFNRNEKN